MKISNEEKLKAAIENHLQGFEMPEGWELTFSLKRHKQSVLIEQQAIAANIQAKVCDFFGISVNDLLAKSNKPDIVLFRYILTLLIKQNTRLSLSQILPYTRNTGDHTNVIHACNKLSDWISVDEGIRFKYEACKAAVLTNDINILHANAA